MLTRESVLSALDEITDPEIPVVSLVELGIVRDIEIETDETVTVTITPTFAGCPALDVMKRDIVTRLAEMGADDVTVETVYSPPWTTDWITTEAREKLREWGIAPPPHLGGQSVEVFLFEPAECPQCGSQNTTVKNEWGPAACKTLNYCNDCKEVFEGFKPL